MPTHAPWTAGRMLLRELVQLERNPKAHDLGAIIDSITRFGYVEPVVVNTRTGHLVHGHGRDDALSVMRDQGLPLPRGVEQAADGDWSVSVYFVDVDEAEEEALTIALNRTSELGGWDEHQLATILAELAEQGEEALRGIGYDMDDVDLLVRSFQFPPLDPVEDDGTLNPGVSSRISVVIRDPYHFEDALAAIRSLVDEHPEWEAEIA